MLLNQRGVLALTLIRKNLKAPLFFSLMEKTNPLSLEENKQFWLHEEEQEILDGLVSSKKRASFLLGRYAAKLVLSRYWNSSDLLCGSVIRGALGQPVVRGDRWDVPEISLAHSGTWGGAICFPAGQQFAIDLEEIRLIPSRVKAILSKLTDHEKNLLEKLSVSMPSERLAYQFWTLKEALSKVLRCGLTLPLEALAIKELHLKGSLLEARFSHFTQYRGISEASEQLSISLVCPWKSKIQLHSGEEL